MDELSKIFSHCDILCGIFLHVFVAVNDEGGVDVSVIQTGEGTSC